MSLFSKHCPGRLPQLAAGVPGCVGILSSPGQGLADPQAGRLGRGDGLKKRAAGAKGRGEVQSARVQAHGAPLHPFVPGSRSVC